jgi:hypothetical protein
LTGRITTRRATRRNAQSTEVFSSDPDTYAQLWMNRSGRDENRRIARLANTKIVSEVVDEMVDRSCYI